MIVITVIDDNMGMMFNNRRQSQDCILREQILALTPVVEQIGRASCRERV